DDGDQRSHLERSASHRRLPRTYGAGPPIIATTAIGSGIGFSREERERHPYIVGKSGSSKSTVLFNLAMHDIIAGRRGLSAEHRRPKGRGAQRTRLRRGRPLFGPWGKT